MEGGKAGRKWKTKKKLPFWLFVWFGLVWFAIAVFTTYLLLHNIYTRNMMMEWMRKEWGERKKIKRWWKKGTRKVYKGNEPPCKAVKRLHNMQFLWIRSEGAQRLYSSVHALRARACVWCVLLKMIACYYYYSFLLLFAKRGDTLCCVSSSVIGRYILNPYGDGGGGRIGEAMPTYPLFSVSDMCVVVVGGGGGSGGCCCRCTYFPNAHCLQVFWTVRWS